MDARSLLAIVGAGDKVLWVPMVPILPRFTGTLENVRLGPEICYARKARAAGGSTVTAELCCQIVREPGRWEGRGIYDMLKADEQQRAQAGQDRAEQINRRLGFQGLRLQCAPTVQTSKP